MKVSMFKRWLRRRANKNAIKSKTPWRSNCDEGKIEAWAIKMGYDPLATTEEKALPEGYLSKDFTQEEFECNCGKNCYPEQGMDQVLIDSLQMLRNHYNVPITINSGYRCPEYNEEIGGAPDSQHIHATASDIVVQGVNPSDVYKLLDPTWEGGLGRYETFTHIDTRAGKARW